MKFQCFFFCIFFFFSFSSFSFFLFFLSSVHSQSCSYPTALFIPTIFDNEWNSVYFRFSHSLFNVLCINFWQITRTRVQSVGCKWDINPLAFHIYKCACVYLFIYTPFKNVILFIYHN